MRNAHSDGAGDEDGFTAKLINVEDGRNSGKHEKDTTNSTGKERGCVAGKTQVLENEGSVVQDGIDTRPYDQSVMVSFRGYE